MIEKRVIFIGLEVIIWLFSFFFFIKHRRSIYEALMLSAFVLGTVDVFLTLWGSDNALFYLVFRNKVAGVEYRVPITLLWIILIKVAFMYLSREILPSFFHKKIDEEVRESGAQEERG